MSKYLFTIPPSTHAELSASGAERWMACAASPRLSVGIERASSAYAAEGTAAHYLAAQALNHETSLPDSMVGKVAQVEGHEVTITEEMIEAVLAYVKFVRSLVGKGDKLFVEVEVTLALKKLHPKLGGHADAVAWKPKAATLHVVDLKFGSGVFVSVVDNKQLRTYALGALLSFPQFKAQKISVTIAQPRLENEDGQFRTETFDAFDLLDFAGSLIQSAQRTEDPAAQPVPGEKQCRWCAAASVPGRCPAMEQAQHRALSTEFADLDANLPAKPYDPAKLAEALALFPLLEARIEAVRAFAYSEAERGAAIPHWKLVAKRGRRQWVSEDAVRRKLLHKQEYYTEPKLKSPAQIEAILGKKVFAAEAAELCEMVSSGNTLAPEADPRPAVKLISADDFNNLEGKSE